MTTSSGRRLLRGFMASRYLCGGGVLPVVGVGSHRRVPPPAQAVGPGRLPATTLAVVTPGRWTSSAAALRRRRPATDDVGGARRRSRITNAAAILGPWPPPAHGAPVSAPSPSRSSPRRPR